MNVQEQLAGPIHAAICYDGWEECVEEFGRCMKAAEAQIAKGIRPPADRITNEEQLSLLPVSAVIHLDGHGPGGIYEKDAKGDWGHPHLFELVPATVLWQPEAGDRR